jgi:hypothetical protein
LLYLKSKLSKAIRLITAACSALLVTLYVSNDWAMFLAAVSAVAHSPAAGALSQVFEVGAMVRIWDSVMVVPALVLVLCTGLWRGWAAERVRRRVRGVRRCIFLLWNGEVEMVVDSRFVGSGC